MITKMKKLTFLVYHKEYEEFLNSLRELGVVHIVEKQQGAADNTELQENIRLSNRLAATLKLLQNQKHEKNAVIATEGGTAARAGRSGCPANRAWKAVAAVAKLCQRERSAGSLG